MKTTPSPQRPVQALEACVEGLKGLEGALLRFEEAPLLELEGGAHNDGAPEEVARAHHSARNRGPLSPSEVCQELTADRAWVHRKLSIGEIPALRLGPAPKVRREDLEEYTKDQQHLRSLARGTASGRDSPPPMENAGLKGLVWGSIPAPLTSRGPQGAEVARGAY